ncbi:transketolase [Lentzea sp. NBRC 105346]|uniref:transketolase family protein n=1 Tax=Lentzea sp. NBRC 105346 TaxID=3032205 RepID=UPI0024A33DB1|nr:transketolase C-terminal domain-containing protein [Lentzea sp. NBRC 105346]GLZ35189.1 transketolase [Lentzea sp. NBRC 105346]
MTLDTWVAEHGTSSRTTCRVAQLELARSDERVYSLENDLALPSVPFGTEFPERYKQIGIAEADLFGVAAGLSMSGRIPYVNTFAVFATMRACEQLRVDLSYPKANVKVVGYYTGLSGGFAGPTHHSMEDIAVTRALPGFTVLSPADAYEAYLATKAAADIKGPVYLRASRGNTPMVYSGEYDFEVGKAVTLREGGDVTIIATGCEIVPRAVRVAERLATKGISCRVLNMHTIKPLDTDAIVAAARETGLVVTYEDHNVMGGLGSAVAGVVLEHAPVPVLRFGVPDIFCTRSDEYDEILDLHGLAVSDVFSAIMGRLR